MTLIYTITEDLGNGWFLCEGNGLVFEKHISSIDPDFLGIWKSKVKIDKLFKESLPKVFAE